MVVDGTFTGYKWQCVEFARRWGLVQRGYVFESIPMAYHIFDLTHVKMVATGKKLPMAAVKNGSRERPEPGSLLIWNHGGEHGFTGHVAVICEALDTGVRIAEQNYKDRAWAPSQNYGRELPVEIDERGNYWIRNKGVLGWMTCAWEELEEEEEALNEGLKEPLAELAAEEGELKQQKKKKMAVTLLLLPRMWRSLAAPSPPRRPGSTSAK